MCFIFLDFFFLTRWPSFTFIYYEITHIARLPITFQQGGKKIIQKEISTSFQVQASNFL